MKLVHAFFHDITLEMVVCVCALDAGPPTDLGAALREAAASAMGGSMLAPAPLLDVSRPAPSGASSFGFSRHGFSRRSPSSWALWLLPVARLSGSPARARSAAGSLCATAAVTSARRAGGGYSDCCVAGHFGGHAFAGGSVARFVGFAAG